MISKQKEQISGLQEQLKDEYLLMSKLQEQVNQLRTKVFNCSIEDSDVDDPEELDREEEDKELDQEEEYIDKELDEDEPNDDDIEDKEEDDEQNDEETDYTRCDEIEKNGERCIRIRRNGNYCWFHDPINPQVCHTCGNRLRIKKGIRVNGSMKDPTGLFEECDRLRCIDKCQKVTEYDEKGRQQDSNTARATARSITTESNTAITTPHQSLYSTNIETSP